MGSGLSPPGCTPKGRWDSGLLILWSVQILRLALSLNPNARPCHHLDVDLSSFRDPTSTKRGDFDKVSSVDVAEGEAKTDVAISQELELSGYIVEVHDDGRDSTTV